MKICHVNLATGFSGGERQNLTLIQQQLKMGYDLNIVANPKSPFFNEIQKLPCKLFSCKQFLLSHSKAITHDTNMIHVHEGRAVYWALIQHLLTNIPYIITRRVDNPLKDKLLLNLAYRKAAHIIGLSSAIKSEVIKLHPNLNVSIIPSSPVSYPSDAKNIEGIRQRYNGKFIVIHAAKLYDHKGFDITIEAARSLEHMPNIHFCILGDGYAEEKLKQQAHKLSNLSFEGRQSRMGDWFGAADLLIHPSYTEGLGSVILEASSAGLPVIGSQAGGIPDIIQDGINGLLVPPGDAESLKNAIQSIYQDATLRDSLIANAPEQLTKFDITYTAQQYHELYATV